MPPAIRNFSLASIDRPRRQTTTNSKSKSVMRGAWAAVRRVREGLASVSLAPAGSTARALSSSSSSSDEIDEFLDRHLSKESNTPGTPKQSVATTRRESLALYRDILRFSRFFTWTDNDGVPFR